MSKRRPYGLLGSTATTGAARYPTVSTDDGPSRICSRAPRVPRGRARAYGAAGLRARERCLRNSLPIIARPSEATTRRAGFSPVDYSKKTRRVRLLVTTPPSLHHGRSSREHHPRGRGHLPQARPDRHRALRGCVPVRHVRDALGICRSSRRAHYGVSFPQTLAIERTDVARVGPRCRPSASACTLASKLTTRHLTPHHTLTPVRRPLSTRHARGREQV